MSLAASHPRYPVVSPNPPRVFAPHGKKHGKLQTSLCHLGPFPSVAAATTWVDMWTYLKICWIFYFSVTRLFVFLLSNKQLYSTEAPQGIYRVHRLLAGVTCL